MNTRERFGNFLLLKKLTEDPLGETFRAGRLGEKGIEQVLLLRVLNGQGLDGRALWRQVESRKQLGEALRSPNIATGVEVGELQGVPYAAYDYVSGTNLASLLEQAKKQHSPVPTDHALLITERVALGLAAAYETRVSDQRVVHGFVVPDLVHLSNEGEARLLGFEIGPGLREAAPSSTAARAFARYLAPEALAGKPPHKSDDVYSLGAMLYELLTGRPLPQGGDLSKALSESVGAYDEEPLPPPIVAFLEKSLAPQAERIGDAVSWHKQLSQLMIDGQYNPTTFNLAFFMHNLFREEIERESRELQSEKKIEPPRAETVEVPIAEAVAEAQEVSPTETVMMSTASFPNEEPAAKPKSNALVLAIAAVLVLAVVGAGAWYFFLRGDAGGDAEQAQLEPPPPAGPTQAELLQAEVDRLKEEMTAVVAEQSKEVEEQLSQQYQERIRKLEEQTRSAQQALEGRRRQEEEEAARIAAEEQAALEKKQAEEQAALEKQKAEEEAAAAEAAEKAEPPPPPQKAVSPPPPPPPPAPAVGLGDLVELGPGVVPPQITKRAQPRVPPTWRRVGRKATVVVKVLVDENGRVIRTELDGPKAGLGVDEAAVAAAEQFEFRPATKQGVRVKMWQSLRFAFDPS